MKLDPKKEYVYRNGEKPWKIIWDSPFNYCKLTTIDRYGNLRYHSLEEGYVLNGIGNEDFDLIEVKPKIKGWVNVSKENRSNSDFYCFTTSHGYKTKEIADMYDHGRIACIEIEFTEGEGL